MKRMFGQSNDVQAVDAFSLGVWKPVGGVRSVRHMGGLLKKWVLFAIRKSAEGCALLGVWKPVEGMHSFRRWQKMPQWGPIA